MNDWEPGVALVLLVEPNAALRLAIGTLLVAEHYQIETIDALQDVLARRHAATRTVAVVAWQVMQGLLAKEHCHDLVEMNPRMPLVVMVPRHWARLLETTDLASAVTGIVPKPFEADQLLACLRSALQSCRAVAPS